VNVISKPGLKKMTAKHPQAEAELLRWYKAAKNARWTSLADVRVAFASADRVGNVLIFNVLHNQLRLVVTVFFPTQRLYIKALLTHKEYERKEWMKWAR
jgi:mRNA interferase HigB